MNIKQRGFLATALAIIVAVIIAGAVGYFVLKRPAPIAQEQTPISLPNQVATTTPRLIQTAPAKQPATPAPTKVVPPPPPKAKVVPPPPPAQMPSGIKATTITSPIAWSVVHPGDTVPIRFTPPAGTVWESVMIIIDDKMKLIKKAPFEANYKVPVEEAGRIEIAVAGFTTDGGRAEGRTDITVVPTAKLESIKFDEQTSLGYMTFFGANDKPMCLMWQVIGTYDDGVKRDVTNYLTSYRTNSGSSDVVAITSVGCLQAKGVGDDYIIAENSLLTAALPIHVRSP